MSILATMRHLNLSYGPRILFNNAELIIQSGDKIGLLGLNGQGKSSLFNILAAQMSADISTPPFELSLAQDPGHGKKVSFFHVPQELDLQEVGTLTPKEFLFNFFPSWGKLFARLEELNHAIEVDYLNDNLLHEQRDLLEKIDHLGAWDIIQKYESYLRYFGLEDTEQKICDLSGGEQKKLLLALGLSHRDSITLWDEPTNHLDLETIKLLEDELLTPSTFFLISHDRHLLSKVCNKIFHLKNGKILKFEGSYQGYLEFLAREEEERAQSLARLKNTLSRETAWMRQGVKARRTRSKKRVENYEELRGKLEKIKSEAKRELDFSLVSGIKKSKELVQIKDATFSYPQQQPLFHGLNLTVHKGDKIGLVGPNGAGKSSLIKLITGALRPTQGTIAMANDLTICYFDQKREDLNGELSAIDFIGDHSEQVILPSGEARHAIGYMEQFHFSRDDVNKPLSSFSGGERARLQLMKNLLKKGDLWIFDEPTNDLDLETIEIFESKLRDFKGSIILISHDRFFLSSVTNKVWILDHGNLEEFSGGYEQAQSYIDALTLEHIINADDPQSPKPAEKSTAILETAAIDKAKLAEEIANIEKNITVLDKVLASYDYGKMNPKEIQEHSLYTKKKEELEEQLLALYEKMD